MCRSIRLLRFTLLAAVMALPAAGTERKDDFDSEAKSRTIWDFCQADSEKLTFERQPDEPATFLRNRISASSTNPTCGRDAAREKLGPRVIEPLREDCPVSSRGLGVQRSELRFKNRDDWQQSEVSHWYTINFKIAGAEGHKLPSCGSQRWVNAQWKYEDLGPNLSPFLAQRFDNGVLYITVEDGFCRCVIAKGPGDPNTVLANRNVASASGKPGMALRDVKPIECVNSRGDEPANACSPLNLKLTAYSQEALISLPDPSKQWVRLTYLVKAGGPRESRFEVYANGRFIVRAEHAYEEKVKFPNRVKFKFGHYRDKVWTSADMLIDRICVSQHVGNCDPSVVVPNE